MTAKCVTIVAVGRAEIQPCEVGELGPSQVLLQAERTLISPGTERAGLLQLPNIRQRFPYPAGYCFAGRVEAVGGEVKHLVPGQRVHTQAPHKGRQVVRAEFVFPIPDGVPAEEAAFSPLIHTSMQAVRKGRVEIGTSVMVVGLGLIGQLACRLARLNGALPVIGADLSAARRDRAAQSCDVTLDPRAPDFAARVAEATGGTGPEVVIEATGFPEVIKTAFELTARMGRVVLLGSTRGNTDNVDFYNLVHKRGLTIYGAHIRAEPAVERQPYLWPRRFEETLALELIAHQRLAVSDLISDRYAVDDAPEAYARLAGWDETLMAIILEWSS